MIASVPTAAAKDSQALKERFVEAFSRKPTPASDWLLPLQKSALERFAELGIPTTRDEDWKYTSLSSLAKLPFLPAAKVSPVLEANLRAEISALAVPAAKGQRMVFVNGQYSESLSDLSALPKGLTVLPISKALESHQAAIESTLQKPIERTSQAFHALNAAFFQDGAFIQVPRGLAVESPIELVFLSTSSSSEAAASFPRNIILVGEGAEAQVIETYRSFGAEPTLTVAITEVQSHVNSNLSHLKIVDDGANAHHIGLVRSKQKRNSRFSNTFASFGGAIVRNEIQTELAEEGSESRLAGLYCAKDSQKIDNFTVVDHSSPHCQSFELYKGILSGEARGVFTGRVLVQKDAQKTDAQQTNKNLLLTDTAVANTKPQLEIYADDVKCTHGAAIGQLDEQAMFYLTSRGIDRGDARSMLTHAFAAEVLEHVRLPEMKELLNRRFNDWLGEDV